MAPYLKLYTKDDWEGLAKLRPLTKVGNHYRDWLGDLYPPENGTDSAPFRQNGESQVCLQAQINPVAVSDKDGTVLFEVKKEQTGASHIVEGDGR
jgi:hypothetical protein